MARSSHCTVTSRRLVGALAAAVAFGVLTVPSAGAVPHDPNAVIAVQDCSADTGSRPPRVRSGWLWGEPLLRRRPVPTA